MSIEEIFTWGFVFFGLVIVLFVIQRILAHLRNRAGRDAYDIENRLR